jgi:hypothetical protein
MKTLLLAGLFLPALLWAEPSAPVPVWEGAPPAETLKAKTRKVSLIKTVTAPT